MPVVAIVNQKGGTGKTTLSINLASAFSELYPTLLLDSDPQGSTLDSADSRSTPQMNLYASELPSGDLTREVRSLAQLRLDNHRLSAGLWPRQRRGRQGCRHSADTE